MPVFTRENLRERLKRGKLEPLYILFGSETYLRDLAAKTIADLAFAGGDFRDFNETSFSLNVEGNLAAALSAAEQLPMMASRRVVRIDDVRIASSTSKDTLREDDESILVAYLKRPAEFSTVIFVADEFDKRRKLAKALIDGAVAVEFSELTDDELAMWARRKIVDSGCEIDERALRLLVALVGSDARRLTNEIEKLSTAALPGTLISTDLVESLIANSREISNFDLTDHLLAGRKDEALKTLKKILDDGGQPIVLLGLIASNMRRLVMAKAAMEAGVDRSQAARLARVRYSDQEAFLATARRADNRKLSQAIDRLAETDIAIKSSIGGSGPAGARLQIEMLVAELSLKL